MPWKVAKSSSCPDSKPWAVVKEGESSPSGCHASREEAIAQQSALYAQEGDSEKSASFPTSFSEAEESDQASEIIFRLDSLNSRFQKLVSNIMDNEEIVDKVSAINVLVDEYTERIQAISQEEPRRGFLKSIANFFGKKEIDYYALENVEQKRTGPAMKRENGMDFPARDYAYVPDSQKPSSWKLRVTESPGKVTVAQLGRAAAALSTGGFRGQKAQIPAAALSAVKRRIRQEYRKLGIKDSDIPAQVQIDDYAPRMKSSFFVTKDRNGAYRWFSVYSNNYRDDDYPPEIITAASHRAFIKGVDEGIFPMPELWLWHYEHPIGDADWVDFTDENLAVASGTFRPGYEKSAEALASYEEPLAVSHGMPKQYIVRDDKDSSIIWFHVTKEISPLPAWAAANKLTGFVVLKKELDKMPISSDKQSFLRSILPEGMFDELNQAVTLAGKNAENEGRESKEIPEQEAQEPEQEQKEETPAYATQEEIASAFSEILGPLVKGVTELTERIGALESVVKELQVEDAEKVSKTASETPRQSLADLISAQFSSGARLASDSPLAKAGPTETPPPKESPTGLPIIDQLMANSRNYGGQYE